MLDFRMFSGRLKGKIGKKRVQTIMMVSAPEKYQNLIPKFWRISNITLKSDVTNIIRGFTDDIGDAMINLAFAEFLCNLEIQYILGEALLSSLALSFKFFSKQSWFFYYYQRILIIIIKCDALHNLAPFVQFKKHENTHGGVLLLD